MMRAVGIPHRSRVSVTFGIVMNPSFWGQILFAVPDLLADKKDREFKLIDRILSGHHGAFYELIAPYERRVFMTAFATLQVEADADEVAQESFLKAFGVCGVFDVAPAHCRE